MVAAIYHWWSDKPIEETFRCPILCSIATFREHNPDLAIYVLDVSKDSNLHDWSKWEEKLNFKAIKYVPYFRKMNFNLDFYSMTEPSRHIDVLDFGMTLKNHDILFYLDADVFCVKPILPIRGLGDHIVTPVYTCHFYFKKTCAKPIQFIELYKSICLKCLQDEKYAKKLYQYCPYMVKGRRLWSEVVTYYLMRTKQDVGLMRHMRTDIYANIDKIYQNEDLNDFKTLHLFFNGISKYDEMDYVCLFNEIRDPVIKWLGEEFVQKLKPNVKDRLSVYDKKFAAHMYQLTKNTGSHPFPKFVDEAFKWAKDHRIQS